MNTNDQAAVEGILRDLAFSGITPPEGSRVRGSFRQARYLEPFALFVEHADGSQWMYMRDGQRKHWKA